MLPMLLLYVGVIVFFFMGLYVMSRWAASYIEGILQGRLDAMEELVNYDRIPEVWLKPFRKQMRKQEKKGSDEKKLARIRTKAQKRCLRHIDELINYVENVNFTDGTDTQATLLESLHAHQEKLSAPGIDVLAQTVIITKVKGNKDTGDEGAADNTESEG